MVAPQDETGFSYEFSDLGRASDPLLTKGTTTFNTTAAVYIILVQWSTDYYNGATGKVDMLYELINVKTNKPVQSERVYEQLTSQNKTIGWSNVPAGSYKFRLTNKGAGYGHGNGFVRVLDEPRKDQFL
ncbi:hypothetical protein [Paenibacillus chitinolyticus]|uniref:hypothetical protein n=1 Tax=Paenibacillus chitinolyticus TaxID=79263 RepID=UPI003641D02A